MARTNEGRAMKPPGWATPLSRPRNLVIAMVVPVLVAGVAAGLLLRGSQEDSAVAPTEVAFQFSWMHTGSFAGYYAAHQQGSYADEGLSVQFLEGGTSIDTVQSVLEGNAQFGITSANHLFRARAEGKPVRAVAVTHQLNPVIFVTRQSSGITHPRQFVGKTIRSSVSNLPLLQTTALRFGISPDQYHVVQTFDYDRFYSGEVEVWVGFHYYSPTRISKEGHELNIIYPDNYGVHFYHNTIFTTDDYVEKHPDIVLRFLRATLLSGWTHVVQNPKTVGPLTAMYNPDIDQAFESDFFTAMVPLFNPGGTPIGWMNSETWAGMADDLVEIGLLDRPIDPTELYTMRFLEEIYGANERTRP